jgi:hypothetical protein
MTKPENSLYKFVKYLRELSIIIFGVAVTLCAGYWISVKNEERDMKLYLNAVKIELEENMKHLEEEAEKFIPTHQYSEYLRSHKKNELNKDSLKAYSNVWYYAASCNFKNNAFEMFKSSGVMRLVKDKELLLSIWDAYKELDNITEQTEFFMQEKWVEMKKEIFTVLNENKIKNDSDISSILGEDLKMIPMYNFHIMGLDVVTLGKYEDALKSTKETIEKLEKTL